MAPPKPFPSSHSADWDRINEALRRADNVDPRNWVTFVEQAFPDEPALAAELWSLLVAGQDEKRVLRSDAPRSVPPEVSGYRILSLLGEGGMGEVWLADQLSPIKRRVALKVLKHGTDTRSVLGRFDAERQALALMDHPGIATILDAGSTASGSPYFAMEYVKGMPVTDFCDLFKLDIEARLSLFRELCAAVQHAHHKGVIHRDLKPSNVLVSQSEGGARVKVIDFGIAKAIGLSLTDGTLHTQVGEFVGSPSYMSPEQAAMGEIGVDTRSDVYSLGVLLYELLTGVRPLNLSGIPLVAIPGALLEREPKAPSTRLGTLGDAIGAIAQRRGLTSRGLTARLERDLDWVVMKSLEKDPGRRYATVDAFAEDLRRHLRHEPVAASPPSLSYRAERFFRRNRGSVLAGMAVLSALAIGGVAATLGFLAEREQRRIAVSRELSSDALAQAASDPELAILLAREAALSAPTSEAERALQSTLASPWIRSLPLARTVSYDISPDRKSLATASGEIWALESGELDRRFPGAADLVYYTPSGDLVLVRRDEVDRVALFSMSRGAEVGEWQFDTTTVAGYPPPIFSGDGTVAAFTNDYGHLGAVVDLEGQSAMRFDSGFEDLSMNWTHFGGFSAGMDVFATASSSTVTIWNQERLQPLRRWQVSLPDSVGKVADRAAEAMGLPNYTEISAMTPEEFGAAVASSFSEVDASADTSEIAAEAAAGYEDFLAALPEEPVITALQLSPDGSRVAILYSVVLVVAETLSGNVVFTVWPVTDFDGDPSWVGGGSLAFGPFGELLASSDGGPTVRIFNARDGSLIRTADHGEGVAELRFSPDGSTLISSSDVDNPLGRVRLWDVATGTSVSSWPAAEVSQFAFSNEGRIAVELEDQVLISDLTSGETVLSIPGQRAGLLSFLDGGRVLLEGTNLWRMPTHPPETIRQGFSGGQLAFLSDDTVAVAMSGSFDSTITTWIVDLKTMARVPGLDAVSGGLLARDEGIAILDGADPQVSVWNPSDGGVSTFDIARPGATVLDVALTAADPSVVVAWAEVEPEGPRAFAPLHVARYRPTDGEVVQSAVMDSLIVQELGSVGAQVELDPDGRHLLLTGGQGVFPAVPPSDSTIKLIEWTRQSQVAEYQWPVWDQGVPSVKFSPAGDAFLAHFGNSTFVFDNESGEFGVLEGSGQQGFLEFQFSPDSRYIAALNRPAIAGSRYTPRGELVDGMLVGGGIEIWHAETGDRLPTSSEGSVILDLAFAPDSRRMAMLDSEGNVRIQPLGIDALVDEAELRVTRPLSDDECRRFLHVERCQD